MPPPLGMRHLVIFTLTEKILKSNYNYGFKIFKIYNICPENTFKKFELRNKT